MEGHVHGETVTRERKEGHNDDNNGEELEKDNDTRLNHYFTLFFPRQCGQFKNNFIIKQATAQYEANQRQQQSGHEITDYFTRQKMCAHLFHIVSSGKRKSHDSLIDLFVQQIMTIKPLCSKKKERRRGSELA